MSKLAKKKGAKHIMKRILITICLIFGLILVGCKKREEQPERVESDKVADVNIVEPNIPTEPNESGPSRAKEPNKVRFREGRMPRVRRLGREVVSDVNVVDVNRLEAVNLKDVPMKDIIEKISEWTNVPVIPTTDEIMKQKITVYSPKKLSRSKALALIYATLMMRGIAHSESEVDGEKIIYLKPIEEAKFGLVPTIPPEQPLAAIEDKSKIVQKFFKLQTYSATEMATLLQPLVGNFGHIGADELTGTLLVIDTVENLISLNEIIKRLDIAEAGPTEIRVFELKYGDPLEIKQVLDMIYQSVGEAFRRRSTDRRVRPFFMRPPSGKSSSSSNPDIISKSAVETSSKTTVKKPVKAKRETTTAVVTRVKQAPEFIAEPRRKWIVVRANPEDMEQIAEWIVKLDIKEPPITEYDRIPIEHAMDVEELATRLNTVLEQMPGVEELKTNVLVLPLPTARQLIVFGSQAKREFIKKLVKDLFDVPEAEEAVTEIFEIKKGDPSEIVQILRLLLGLEVKETRRTTPVRSRSYPSSSLRRPTSSTSSRTSSSRSAGTTIELPIVLIPEPKRKWIIVRASAEDMKVIAEWIKKLDEEEPPKTEYDIIPAKFVDVEDLANRVNSMLAEIPGIELRANVLIEPLARSRQLIVFGSKSDREFIRGLVEEIDISAGAIYETKTFKLKHIDAEEIKNMLDELYQEGVRGVFYFPYSRRREISPDEVRTIAHTMHNQVTVIASPENMRAIEKQIEEWDQPLDVEKVKPLIIELKNLDPVQIADLLTTLFSEETTGARGVMQQFFLGVRPETRREVVGPLFGQITVEAIPDTKKLLVISKIPEAYKVIEELVRNLDKKEPAELPRLVILKYADPEDLADRLNAIFNEPGTSARISRMERGLEAVEMGEESTVRDQQQQQPTSTGEYTPWWSGSGARTRVGEEMPISNVIGRIRIIPDPRSKALLILAHSEYLDEIEQMITELDKPGKQVMIKAIVVQVDHSKMTSLGVQLATNPAAFGTLGENAITTLNQFIFQKRRGMLVSDASNVGGAAVGGARSSSFVFDTTTDVTALIDLLIKKTDAKILNQQTLWTKDNEDAQFFKGQRVGFISGATISPEGRVTSQDITFERVGMTLAVRPNITPEKNVDMIINVSISQLTLDLINEQPVRNEMQTETNMIVQDGQTIMLGGILFQEDSIIERKPPLLGDLPLIGGLLKHNSTIKAENEMLIFITPLVIDEEGRVEDVVDIGDGIEKMDAVKQHMDKMSRWLETAE